MTIANTNVIAKVAAVVAGLGLVFSSFAYAVPAKAATMEELQAQIAALMAQIAAMSGGSSTSTGAAFTADMTIGASGSEVTRLQNWLISKGYSIPAGATGYFGAQTAAALAAYQTASGITPAAGYFGPITRAKVNATLGSTGGSTGGSTSGDLEGGAGSVDSYTLMSSLNNEEVGEDEEEVEVAGLEIEVDDGSDLEFTAVRLFIEEGATSNADLEDYATGVSIMLYGEEVANVDIEDFGDDDDADSDASNDWTKTVSLDGGAIIRAGDTGELTVAFSGVGNLDSSDAGDSWTVDFTQVRFVDANGASISEDPTTAARTFTFNTFASTADIELKVSLTDGDEADAINDAHVINVHSSSNTDEAEVLAFDLEAEGDSDVTIDEIPVEITTAGMNIDDSIPTAYLYADGEEIGSENLTATDTDETVTFDDLDFTIDAGETVEFVVKVDINDLDATGGAEVADGDTIQAQITATERALIDAEDESGEAVATGDMTGTAVGDAHAIYDIAFNLEFVSADAEKTFESETAATGDRGTFVLKYDVTAFDGDIYVDNTCVEDNDGSEVATATSFSVSNNGSNSASCTVTSTGTTDSGTAFLISEGDTETITLTVQVTASADSSAYVSLEAIGWDDAAGGDVNVFDFDLPGDYKTDPVFLDLF